PDGSHGDVERDARAVDDAAEHVAAEAVGTEERLGTGARLDQLEVLLVWGMGARIPAKTAMMMTTNARTVPVTTTALWKVRRICRPHCAQGRATRSISITPGGIASGARLAGRPSACQWQAARARAFDTDGRPLYSRRTPIPQRRGTHARYRGDPEG